jgi:serine/threonine protein kinase
MSAGRSGTGRVVAGRYLLRDALGQGGMGIVWLAFDPVLRREVAVKEVTFPPYLDDDECWVLRERTMREARAAARFQHPNATTVHDVVEEDGKPWIVMEHVRSRSLAEAINKWGPMHPRQAARIGLELLAALEAAHSAGIVHRDVKPANVLLDDEGKAWLTDFGIALSSEETALTRGSVLLGSPAYMAPERAHGLEPGPAADLWSLGATLYTAVEGRPPFDRGTPMATLLAVASQEPAPFRAAGPLVPVLKGLLTKPVAERMTAGQARAALELILASGRDDEVPAAQPAPDLESAARAGLVERLDLAELSSVAAAATRSVARRAARTAVRTAASRLDRARAGQGRGTADDAGRERPEPTQKRPKKRSPERLQDRTQPLPSGRPRRRFRRRWIAIPLVVIVLLFILVVGVVVFVAWAVLM